MLNDIDLLLWDLKIMDDARHKDLTGISNRLILENLRCVAELGRSTIVRFTLVPGVNDDKGNVEQIGEFVASLAGVNRIDLLPYHRAGTAKSRSLSGAPGGLRQESRLEEAAGDRSAFSVEAPAPEILESVRERLAAMGLEVRIGG
jgi:pyruvate formate lyase activating enzyme